MEIVVHAPTDEASMNQLLKDLSVFHREQALQYLAKLSLNERQLARLIACLEAVRQ